MTTTEFDISQVRSPFGEKVIAAVRALVARIGTSWTALRNRRSVAQLLDWDSRMLSDIGLTSGDVASALSGPLAEDPSQRLTLYSVERRAAQRAAAREMLAFTSDGKVTPLQRPVRPHRLLEI